MNNNKKSIKEIILILLAIISFIVYGIVGMYIIGSNKTKDPYIEKISIITYIENDDDTQ